MGGVHKKPISAIEKRTRRMMEKEKKKPTKTLTETEKRERSVIVTQELVKAVEKEVRNSKVITPYLIMSRFDITYGNAKRVLKQLAKKGIIKEVSRNRRVIVYLPAAK